MLKPSLICRIILLLLWFAFTTAGVWFTHRDIFYLAMPIGRAWLWIYLSGLRIEICGGCLTKHAGNIFKRTSIIMLKNIFYIQITILAPWRPALVRLHSPTGTMLVLGLDGRQAALIEKRVKTYSRY